jgi:hypothetical protein
MCQSIILGVYHLTSPPSEKYNCIAWAAGDATQWWWPDEGPGIFWPDGIPKEETTAAFVAVFASLGYADCPNVDYEMGFEKVALFADAENRFNAGCGMICALRVLPDGLHVLCTGGDGTLRLWRLPIVRE